MSEKIAVASKKGYTRKINRRKAIMNILQSRRGPLHQSQRPNNHDLNDANNGGIATDMSYKFRNLTLDEVDESTIFYKTKPIADLFPSATIFYGDLVGEFNFFFKQNHYS